MEKTGTWIWPDRYSDLKRIEVTKKDLDFIRSLLVGWDIAELGAPGLMTKEGDWLYDIFENEHRKESLLSVFFNQAKLNLGRFTYQNPITMQDLKADVKEELLYTLPNKDLKKQLQTQEVIELDIDETFLKVLNSCDLRASGFDPKRGFRLTNLQELIDPEKKQSKSEITKLRKQYKGQLFLYLQLFLKEATLETGFYRSYDNYNWNKGKDFGIAEKRTAREWYLSFNSDYFSTISEYIDLLKIIPKIDRRLTNNYSEKRNYQNLVEIFHLNNLFQYDYDNMKRIDVDLIEILLTALNHFPEEYQLYEDGYSFVQLAVRLLNATGRFKEAKALLQKANLDFYQSEQLDFFVTKPSKYQQAAFYESCIAQMGITGDYSLWVFPTYPKYTEEEFIKYSISKSFFGKDSPEYKEELKKIKKAEEDRKLAIDLRTYLDYTFRFDLDEIYEDLETKGYRSDNDEILVSIFGQIHVMNALV